MATVLTDAIVAKLDAPVKGLRIVKDAKVRGFGVRLTPAGGRSFVLDYFAAGGKRTVFTIGKFPAWKTAAARAKAEELKGQIRFTGKDPSATVQEHRHAKTVGDAWSRFEQEQEAMTPDEHGKLRKATLDQYRAMAKHHILPRFKNTPLRDLRADDVKEARRTITKRTAADYFVAVMKMLLNKAIGWEGYGIEHNPLRGIKGRTHAPRRRILSAEERDRLWAALASDEDQQACDVIRVLRFTGCRRNEALGMTWKEIDFATATWTLPSHRTKTHETREVHLVPQVMDILVRIKNEQKPASDYVFPGEGDTGHREGIRKPWNRIRKAAKLGDFRLHDLRRSYASAAVSSGLSLEMVGQLLGHTTAQTTKGYAYLEKQAAKAAAAKAAAAIAGEPMPTAQVIPLRPL